MALHRMQRSTVRKIAMKLKGAFKFPKKIKRKNKNRSYRGGS